MQRSLELRQQIGKMLSTQRKDQKLSLETIAKRLGVARSTVYNIEGANNSPHFEIVVAYAHTLGPVAVVQLNKLVATFRFVASA